MLRVLDLFSGIGGFSLGLERTGGFKTVAFCEIDPFCRQVLAKHWPDVPTHDDVTTRAFSEGEADVITAGFPCQDISLAGAGAGLSGTRSGLWREVVRAVRLVRPVYTILENVAALLGRGMGTVLGDLAESGNDAEWDCLPAFPFGAPHARDRIWIVAYPNARRGRANPAGRHNANGTDARRTQADSLPGEVSEQRHSGQVAAHTDADSEGRLQLPWVFCHVGRRIDDGSAASPEWATPWPEKLSQIQGMDDGISDRLDKAGIDATGNTILPQIPTAIGYGILAAEREGKAA
jgi:DNA (cytosine-5)-methyltransferase 1